MIDATNENQKFEPTAQQKKLLRLVYIMGIVFVLLFLGLIGGLIWRASSKSKPAAPAPVLAQDLGIAPADIRHLALEGDRLAVTTGTELIVIDLKSKTVLLRIGK